MSKDVIEVSLVEALDINTAYTVDEESKSVLLSIGELKESEGSALVAVFEAAVNTKVKELTETVAGRYQEILEAKVGEVREQLENQMDAFLGDIVEEWFDENKPVIAESLQVQNNNKLVAGILTLLKDNYVEVPEDRRDLLAELSGRVTELEESLNAANAGNTALKLQIAGAKCEAIFKELSEGLAATEVERFESLIEELDIDQPEVFEAKAAHIKKAFFTKGSTPTKTNEVTEGKDGKASAAAAADDVLARAKAALGRRS